MGCLRCRQRLWYPQAGRPFSSTVSPPADHGWMWSISQSSAARSQNSEKHCRSRTSTPRRVAPLKMRRRTPTLWMRSALSKTTRSTHPSSNHRTRDPGDRTVPSANSHVRPAKVS